MSSTEQVKSITGAVLKGFGREPRAKQPKQKEVKITLDERGYLIRRLMHVCERSGRIPANWKAELQVLFDSHRIFAPLRTELNGIKPSSRGASRDDEDGKGNGNKGQAARRLERELMELIERAIQLVESQPVLVLEETLRLQIDATLNKWLWRTLAFAAPMLIAAIVGGTVLGYHIEGLAKGAENAAQAAMKRIEESDRAVSAAVRSATEGATKITAMNAQAEGQLHELENRFTQLTKTANATATGLNTQSESIRTSAETIGSLKTNIENLQKGYDDLIKQLNDAKTIIDTGTRELAAFSAMSESGRASILKTFVFVAGTKATLFVALVVLSALGFGFSSWTWYRLRKV